MRRALVVGINDYSWAPLKGCVNDATQIGNILERHHNGKQNFHVKRLTSDKDKVTKPQLFRSVRELFQRPAELVIFFFSGHGADSDLGGYLVTQDGEKHDLGVSLNEIVELANMATHINEILIIVDACYSGHTGNTDPLSGGIAILRKGVSVLASSMKNENSYEKNGQGVFTSVMLEALSGGASDIMGHITVAGMYNYADKVLGPWQQRPVFKSHLTELSYIRITEPEIPFVELRLLDDYFPTLDAEYPLSPAYEPQAAPKDVEKEAIFAMLQRFRAANLIEPVGEEHMYYAAINSGSCRLTPQGKLYWKMVQLNKI
jgi:uncharacterized caspase-like protein